MVRLHPIKYGLASAVAALGMLAIVAAPAASGALSRNLLSLHLVLEMFAIMIAALAVTVSWYTFDRQSGQSGNVFIAGFMAVAVCDLLHALTYVGMPPFLVESSTPRAIFFWLMGRSIEVVTLGTIAVGIVPRLPRWVFLLAGLLVSAATVGFGTFALDRFPVTFVDGTGVTPFKARYEYVLVVLNTVLALLLWRKAVRENSRTLALLALSSFFMALGGFAFTSYLEPSDFQNLAGHLYKVMSYALLFQATFITSIRAPYEALARSEARVRESQARMNTLSANLPQAVLYQLVMEPDGRRYFTQVSDSVQRIVGVSAADALRDSRRLYQLIHPDDVPALVETENRCAKSLQTFDTEARFFLPDGSLRRMHLVSAPRRMDEGRIMWDGIMTDVTERTEAQESRRLLERQLSETQKMESIGTLASGIAHDFNNVLTSILGNARMALEDVKSNQLQGAAVSLEQIQKAGARAKGLVQQILSFGRRDTPKRQVQRLLPVVQESLLLLRATLPAGVQLLEQIEDPEACAEIDRIQLGQVLLNLCTNAWHAVGDKDGRIAVGLGTVTLESNSSLPLGLLPGLHAHLFVEDNGCGMDEQMCQKIFEPFFTTKPVGKGTGLGLSVVHGIVKAHNGSISVRSQPGVGTRFDILIPTGPDMVAPAPDAVEAVPQKTVLAHGERVLLIEDDLLTSATIVKLLTRSGYRVEHHSDADQAMAALRKDLGAFDIVVTDFNMPRHSGLEVIAALKRQRPDLPAILISGYVSDDLRAQAAALGVLHILEKTCALDTLAPLITDILEHPIDAGTPIVSTPITQPAH